MHIDLNNLNAKSLNNASALFDPDLPTASSVMASLNCVAVRFAINPSEDLAILAADLAYTLTAPEYAESSLIEEVAKNLVQLWDSVVNQYQINNGLSSSRITTIQ